MIDEHGETGKINEDQRDEDGHPCMSDSYEKVAADFTDEAKVKVKNITGQCSADVEHAMLKDSHLQVEPIVILQQKIFVRHQ